MLSTLTHRFQTRERCAEDHNRASILAGVGDRMGRRLYVGNLPYSATEEQLTELFSRAGKVDNVRVMRDMATGRARGFAFVEMGSDEDAQKAISEFHEQQMDGRALVVNEARPKPEGGFGGGGRGRGGGGGRSYDDGDFSGGRRKEPRW
jgi:RNA recognition motif-containing protein